MPSHKIVTAHNEGWCAAEYAHDSKIKRGDEILVTTYFPNDEHCRDFGVLPFTRIRRCTHCLEHHLEKQKRNHQN